MMMRVGRTLPPAAAPIPFKTIVQALPACFDRSGQANRNFAEELKQFFSSKHCFLLSSGKAALTLILAALQKIYPDRDEVLVVPFTCYSVPAAVQRARLRIKLCDLAPLSLDFDREQLQEIISADRENNKILCVVVTHLFGYPADVDGIREIVGDAIPIIEDAAQAMGAGRAGQQLGTLSGVGFFSLGRGKALSTLSGGVIVAEREDLGDVLGEMVRSLPGHTVTDNLQQIVQAVLISLLQQPRLFWLPRALPFLRLGETLYEKDFSVSHLSSVQAAFGRGWQKRLARHQEARQKNIVFWSKVLPETCRPWSRTRSLHDADLIRFPLLAPSNPVRKEILESSASMGLGIMPSYPAPLHLLVDLAVYFKNASFPVAEDICSRLLTLPVHEYVTTEDNEKILQLLSRYDLGEEKVHLC